MSTRRTVRAHVVVSPHPDDAVWSLGGRLARWVSRGAPVTVVTVFDGPSTPGPSPPGAPDGWRRVAHPAVRRREDRAALGELGVGHISLGFTDAALRTTDGRHRYRSAPRVFAAPHPDDGDLPRAIRDALRPLCPPGARVYGPLAAGRHVDHVVSRAAVEQLAAPGTTWYEDFPYPLRGRDHDGLAVRRSPLTDTEVERWLAAALHYTSQAEALFGGADGLRRALLARVRTHGAEAGTPYADRYWLRVDPDIP